MAASNLLSSAFATPGRRAHGSLGTLPAGFTWGDEVWGALNIAEHVETSAPFHTKIRAPCFGMGTVKVTGQPKGVTALFQALAFVHTGERPDIVVVLGRWCVHRPWLTEYYGKKLTAAQLRKANEHADGWWLADWPDAIGLRDFEGMQRVAIRGAPDPGVGLVAGDVDAHPLNGVVHRDPTKSWRLIVTDAEASGLASLAELDALLPAVNLPPPLLLPPSGIPPAADVLERCGADLGSHVSAGLDEAFLHVDLVHKLAVGERANDGRRVRLVLLSRLGRACERPVTVVGRRRSWARRFARCAAHSRASPLRFGARSSAAGRVRRGRCERDLPPPRGFFLIFLRKPNLSAKSLETIANFGVRRICNFSARFPLVFAGAFRRASDSFGLIPCAPFGPRSCSRSQPSGTSACSVPWLTRWCDLFAGSSACGCGGGCCCCSSGDCGRCCCCGCGVGLVPPVGVGVGCAAFLRGFCSTSRMRFRSSSGRAWPLVATSHVNGFCFGALRAAGPRETFLERARFWAAGAGAPAWPPRLTPPPASPAGGLAAVPAASAPSFCPGEASMPGCVRAQKKPLDFGGKRRRACHGRASSHVRRHD